MAPIPKSAWSLFLASAKLQITCEPDESTKEGKGTNDEPKRGQRAFNAHQDVQPDKRMAFVEDIQFVFKNSKMLDSDLHLPVRII